MRFKDRVAELDLRQVAGSNKLTTKTHNLREGLLTDNVKTNLNVSMTDGIKANL